MRYRGGGVGHRILWPLRELMLAVGHIRPKHQPKASRKGKERMEEPEEVDELDELVGGEDELAQMIAYDDDIIHADPDEKIGDDTQTIDPQELEDEQQDYGYGEDDVLDTLNADEEEEEEEVFDVFDP